MLFSSPSLHANIFTKKSRCFHPHVVSILYTGPSLHNFNFYRKNYTPSFLPFLCVSGTKLCHVKIGNTANSPNKNSFIYFCVPQARTLAITTRQFNLANTIAPVLIHLLFLSASSIPPTEANGQMLCTAVTL